MNTFTHYASRAIWFLLLVLMVVGCQDDTPAGQTPVPPTPTIPPTPTPDPTVVLRSAANAMLNLDSVHVEITREGGPAYLDPDQTLNLSGAVGDYAAPDAIQAIVTVLGPGIALEIQTVAIGNEQWITNPLTQQWELLPPGWGFNPAILFDEAIGWLPLLTENVSNATIVETTEIGGQVRQRLQATVAGESVTAVTGGIVQATTPVTVDIWLDPATFYVSSLSFELPDPAGGEPSQWELTFSNYNVPVSIEPPVVSGG